MSNMSDQWATSNSTASLFLGGGRLPAWLSLSNGTANASDPRHQPPRHQPRRKPVAAPRNSTAASAPLTAASAPLSAASVPPLNASAASCQPQHLIAPAPHPASVLPSPTPSDDRNCDKTPAPVELDSPEPSSSPPVHNGAPSYKRRRLQSAANVRVNTALPRPPSNHTHVRTREPSPNNNTAPMPQPQPQYGGSVGLPPATDMHVRTGSQSFQSNNAPMPRPRLGGPVSVPPATDTQVRPSLLQINIAPVPQTQPQVGSPASFPHATDIHSQSLQSSVASMPNSQVQSPVTGLPATHLQLRSNARPLQGSGASMHHPRVQSPISAPESPSSCSLPEALAAIISLKARYAGTGVLERDPARYRLLCLEKAVRENDVTYLFFHQVHCLAARGLGLPPEFSQINGLPGALEVLGSFLHSTAQLGPELLVWFSNFPLRYEQRGNQYFRNGLRSFTLFASLVAENWLPFYQSWEQRRYPPLARELDKGLGVSSKILQRHVFLGIACRLGFGVGQGTSSSSLQEAEEVFNENLRWWQTIKSLRMTRRHSPAISKQEAEIEYQTYGAQYLGILQRSRRVQTQAHAQPGPLAALPTAPRHHISRQSNGTGFQTPTSGQHPVMRSTVPSAHTPPAYGISPAMPQIQSPAFQPRISGPVQGLQRPPQTNAPRPLIPPAGHTSAQPAIPNPNFFALHQAHLRSPVLMAKPDPHLDTQPRLFQQVIGFAMSPRPIDGEKTMQTFEFHVPVSAFVKKADYWHSNMGQVPMELVDDSTITYRLRCARSPLSNESNWLLADNVWPEGVYMEINSRDLEFRRKLQHGKDLPVDLTPHIREGSNELKIAVVKMDTQPSLAGWALAVEVVGIITEEFIKQDCLKNKLIEAEIIKNGITKHLNADENGDELVIVNDSITINLVDPFSGCQICKIPVRGVNCPHREAFDLEVFLQTRARKKPNAASYVDVWRCPICKGDARPKSLIVDGFLLEVRAKLAEQGLLNTRSIILEKDGSWKPVPEKDDERGESTKPEAQPQSSKTPSTGVQRVVDIIDLDSD